MQSQVTGKPRRSETAAPHTLKYESFPCYHKAGPRSAGVDLKVPHRADRCMTRSQAEIQVRHTGHCNCNHGIFSSVSCIQADNWRFRRAGSGEVLPRRRTGDVGDGDQGEDARRCSEAIKKKASHGFLRGTANKGRIE
jgi:hypothetical protein